MTIQCDRLTEKADFGKKKKHLFREAHFDLDGYVNKQNCHIWGTENPHAYIEKPTYPKQCGVWSRGIIGQFFYENKRGEAVTFNGDRYRAMLNEFLFTNIKEEDIGNIWFQQDGATCHTAKATLDVLRSVFQDRIISRRADKPETIDALKDNIRKAVGEIQLHTIDNVLKNWTSIV